MLVTTLFRAAVNHKYLLTEFSSYWPGDDPAQPAHHQCAPTRGSCAEGRAQQPWRPSSACTVAAADLAFHYPLHPKTDTRDAAARCAVREGRSTQQLVRR